MYGRLTLISVFLLLCCPVQATDFSDWQHGAVGYFKAERFARSRQKPMVVFFHADWCSKCARLKANFLADRSVKRLLDRYSRVEINPELGPKDYAIFQEYQVQAVPGFFVTFPSFEAKTKRIHPLGINKDWSVERFRREIASYTALVYQEVGVQRLSAGDYREAAKLLEESLVFDDQNGETYFQLGKCYEGMGNSTYGQRAQQYYAKAARLDSKYKDLRP